MKPLPAVLAAILLCTNCPLALAGSSALARSDRPGYPGLWLWEPVTRLAPQSSGVDIGPRDERGTQLTIKPGGAALLYLPADHWLRLQADYAGEPVPAGTAYRAAPDLWYSRGNGLFVPAQLQRIRGVEEWLLPPDQSSEALLLLENRGIEPARWWLSQVIPQGTGNQYRSIETVISPPGDTGWFYQPHRGAHLQLSKLNAGEEYSIDLEGPGRWRLEARILADSRPDTQPFVELPVNLNDSFWRDWRIHPRIDHHTPLQSRQCRQLSSTAESLHISLPEGNHSISFTAPRHMAVRMLSLQPEDFVFARNQPVSTVGDFAGQLQTGAAPSAHTRYDEQRFSTLLEAPYPVPAMPAFADQLDRELASYRAADRLVEARYRLWRPLPVAGAEQTRYKVHFVDVALAETKRGKKRYLLPQGEEHESLQTLLRLEPGRSIQLDAPDQRAHTIVKLSLPITHEPYDIELKNRQGVTKFWRWRPALIQSGMLDVTNQRNLAGLMTGAKGRELATASASFTVERDEFPLSVSHSASGVIWFSPFYRDNTHPALSQAAWERALDRLGARQMLALLLSDTRPDYNTPGTPGQQLRRKVWDDWQPLRRWLRSYRGIWTSGLINDARMEQPLQLEELSLLTGRQDSNADHLLTQLLRGAAVRGTDPVQREKALQWLRAFYARTDNRANLNAFYSWSFQHAPQQQMQPLADWLLVSNLEEMALRLYRLANTPSTHLPYQQARLNSGWRLDQDAFNPLISTWEAVWAGDWTDAVRYSEGLDEDHPWRRYLSLLPDDSDPVSWLKWLDEAPGTMVGGVPARTSTQLVPDGGAGTVHAYVTGRDLHMKRSLAQPDAPVRYTVIGPVDLQLTVSLRHDDPLEELDDWIEIEDNGVQRWLAVIDSTVNPGIIQMPQTAPGHIGTQQRATLSLGPGWHELAIRPLKHNGLVDVRLLSPLLLAGAIEGLQPTVPTARGVGLTAGELLTDLDLISLSDCSRETAGHEQKYHLAKLSVDDPPDPVPLATQWFAPQTLSSLEAPAPDEPVSGDDVEQYLLQLLWHWPPAEEGQRRRVIARANALAAPHYDHGLVTKVLRKLNSGHGWQLEETVTASSGSRRVPATSSSEHPVMIAREKLLTDAERPPGEQLRGRERVGIFTQFTSPTTVRLHLRQFHLPYHEKPPARVLITLNDEPIRVVDLPPAQQQISIRVPPGPQQLRLQLEEPGSDHWLYVQARANLDGHWQSLLTEKRRRYHVATAKEPLELYIPEARWLRVDEYRNGSITREYRWHEQPGPLQLWPPLDESSAMYRVFSWREGRGDTALRGYALDTPTIGPDDRAGFRPGQNEVLTVAAPDYQWSAGQWTRNSADSTDGVYLQLRSRLDLDTDAAGNADERFAEAGWRHRKALECLACYWRSDLFGRKHDREDIQVLGTRQRLQGDWTQSSWRWELAQSLWLQTGPETDWSWHGTATATDTHEINETMAHEYELQVFGRYLSADDPDYPVDNDIYTRYKKQHRHGLKLGATLRGRPWRDSLWTARASLNSNEDFNPVQPDYVQANVAWRQYWRPLAFSGEYRHRLYLSDDDRDSSLHRPALRLAVDSLTTFPAGQLLQWSAGMDYDLDRGEYGFTLSMSWDLSRGRGLRDFYPGSSSFHSLRSRDISTDLYRHQSSSEHRHD